MSALPNHDISMTLYDFGDNYKRSVAKQNHEAIHRFMTFMGWPAPDWAASQGTAKGTNFPSDSHFQP